ncbi:MAG: dihydroorotate dehydrogenase electron transfer subunit [Vulcanimicrobiaceae bacterium]
MPTLQSVAAVHSTRVLDRTELAQGVILLGLHAPELVHVTRPGHFVMVTPPMGETAAVALGVYEAQGERASIMFAVCGSRTRELAALGAGSKLDLFGPLGNGFDLAGEARDVAIVAGGIGIASVLLPAQALIARGARVRLFYGARTAALLVDEQKFAAAGCEVLCATDDGSAGHHGVITDLLQKAPDKPDLLLACGPSPMLRAVGKVARAMNVPAQLSLEETFACGVGACWGCVVPLDRASAQAPKFPLLSTDGSDSQTPVNARICKEGPVFWAHELRW